MLYNMISLIKFRDFIFQKYSDIFQGFYFVYEIKIIEMYAFRQKIGQFLNFKYLDNFCIFYFRESKFFYFIENDKFF